MTFRRLSLVVVGIAVLLPSLSFAQAGLPSGVRRITSVEGITDGKLA